MVNRILTLFNKEFHGVNEAALMLGIFSFLSQLLGLVRDRLLASYIGAGPTLDVYYAAFRVPDFLYVSIASLASITVLLPFLVEKLSDEKNNIENARKFMNNVFSAYMIFMVFICLAIFIAMPFLAHLIAPGFSISQIHDLVLTSRIMLLSPIFIGLSNLIGTVTQYFKNFLVFSLSPVFYNIGIIFGIVFLYKSFGVYGLGFGVIIGALMHLLIQIPTVVKRGLFPTFVSHINWKEIYSVVKLSLPRTLALSCGSFVSIVLISIASNLKPGSISLFTFSFNLQSVPVGIIGISYSVAAFPILVKSFATKDDGGFIKHIISTARQIIFWSLPSIALMIVLRAQIVRVILGVNTFSWANTRLTAAATAIFIISLLSQSLVLLFVRGYYAAGHTKKPLFVNVFSSFATIAFAFIFMYIFRQYHGVLSGLESLLRVKDVPDTIMLALPLSYMFGSLLNFFLIWHMFKQDFFRNSSSGLRDAFLQSSISAIIIGVVSYLALGILDDIFVVNTFRGIFLQGLVAGMFGISAGIFALSIMKNKELKDLASVLSHKFWKNRVVAPEQREL